MKYSMLFGLSIMLLAACRKDDTITCDPSASSLADLRAAAPAFQLFSFNAGQAQSFRTSGGATVAFPANSFFLPNGTAATGQAVLRVREIYSVPDMLLADIPTTVSRDFNRTRYTQQMLISGGEFVIQAWQGSTRLRFNPARPSPTTTGPFGLSLTSPIPAAGLDTTRMLLWNWPVSTNPAVAALTGAAALIARDSSGWQLVTRDTMGVFSAPVQVPSVAGYYAATLPLDSIGTWNIDQLWHAYQGGLAGTIQVEVPFSNTATISRVFMRPVGYNGLARCVHAYYPAGTTRWSCVLPYGADMVAVVIQERAGQLYYGTQRVTTAANQVVTPTLEALSTAEIIRRVRLL